KYRGARVRQRERQRGKDGRWKKLDVQRRTKRERERERERERDLMHIIQMHLHVVSLLFELANERQSLGQPVSFLGEFLFVLLDGFSELGVLSLLLGHQGVFLLGFLFQLPVF